MTSYKEEVSDLAVLWTTEKALLQRLVHMAQYITGAELPASMRQEGPKHFQRLQPPKPLTVRSATAPQGALSLGPKGS
jgi:hypothetical protein